ncbi:secretion protein HlyD family protein [Xylanimonas cellulosilytica DSM 15894]|uniref:Secretion protein HlyD family protein n=1 Tax=Xylanimonas cellulosilytica (strain DSM 15894 / JCM 12276 / CECT 5975 / KCTC 9989 / LMG 20990 / NBRC 107835 / XIL07) TaxID=446471 RepID=D1BX80_XYLCX|nr:DUF4307 domain-containing protein [Xylanimonas cellulosilytica]ACZ31648.1 secretion protein HlyD family protein [Xylanimonas cellulosilytica DSM 15894]
MSDDVRPTPPADRYGRRPTGPAEGRPGGLSRGARAAIALALAVAVALTAWFAVAEYRRSPVDADVVSFRVTSSEEIEIDFQVSLPRGTTAVCTVGALSPSFAQVGSLAVPVGPSDTGTVRYTVTVRTTQRADAAVIEGCISG